MNQKSWRAVLYFSRKSERRGREFYQIHGKVLHPSPQVINDWSLGVNCFLKISTTFLDVLIFVQHARIGSVKAIEI